MYIGILTYYNVHNYGAVLQANALRVTITSLGHQCKFLVFDRDYSMISQKTAAKYKIGFRSIPFYIRYLCEKGAGNIIYNLNKKCILDKYRRRRLPLGERYDCFSGDVAVIGSDEVFSAEVGINPFFYGNGLKTRRIISYAGSFGSTTADDIKRNHLGRMISEGFGRMDAVSVRDRNSWEIVELFSNRDVALVCDPVILYGYGDEMRRFKPPLEDYIIIYSYDKNMNDKEDIENIKKYADGCHLKVVSVGFYHQWCRNVAADPEQLLGWFKNARLVVTDTFHGAVLSIICNTPMIVRARREVNKTTFLMGEYGLSNRVVQDFSELETIAGQQIDFDTVNLLVNESRKKSMEFLKKHLGGRKDARY